MLLIKRLHTFFQSLAGREMLRHGMKPLPTHQDSIMADVRRVLEYSQTTSYHAWEQEVWAQIDSNLKTILSPHASERDVTLARGQLIASLDLLRVADKAQKKQKEQEQKKQGMSPTLKA